MLTTAKTEIPWLIKKIFFRQLWKAFSPLKWTCAISAEIDFRVGEGTYWKRYKLWLGLILQYQYLIPILCNVALDSPTTKVAALSQSTSRPRLIRLISCTYQYKPRQTKKIRDKATLFLWVFIPKSRVLVLYWVIKIHKVFLVQDVSKGVRF